MKQRFHMYMVAGAMIALGSVYVSCKKVEEPVEAQTPPSPPPQEAPIFIKPRPVEIVPETRTTPPVASPKVEPADSGNDIETYIPVEQSGTGEDAFTKTQVQRDLSLQVRLISEKSIGPGAPINLSCRIANNSGKNTYTVVQPGDGSEMGWREPYMYYSASRLNLEGEKAIVLKSTYQRPAVFDTNWNKDIVLIGPGEEIAINSWLKPPHVMLEIQEAGVYHISVHYVFNKGLRCSRKDFTHEQALAKTLHMPAFELISKPVVVLVKRPIDMEVKIKAPLKVKQLTWLSTMMDISLVNRSNSPHDVLPPNLFRDPSLFFEIKGEYESFLPKLKKQKHVNKTKRRLQPQEEMPILGKGMDLAENIDGQWKYPIEETVMLRAIYKTAPDEPKPIVLKSKWVKVDVVE